MATNITLPTFPRSKMFVDLESQTMSREWLDFLLKLFEATQLENRVLGADGEITVTDNGDGTITLSLT